MARKKIIKEEEDPSSESEKLQNSSKKGVLEDPSATEDESDEEIAYNSYTNPAEFLKEDGIFPLDLKLKLIKEIKEHNKRKTLSYRTAVKQLDWNLIKIDEYSTEELKACLDEILSPIASIRTLDEMLNDYEVNHVKFDLKMHPDTPKQPKNAFFRFIDDNREKIKKALAKEMPNQKIGLGQIYSYGAKKFAALPEKEQNRYKEEYRVELAEYIEKRDEFLRKNPDMVKKKPKKEREKKVRAEKAPKKPKRKVELPFITPFMVYREALEQEGKNVAYKDAQSMYKNMPDDEKIFYIEKLINMTTTREKQYSKEELKILKKSNGMPTKPCSAYNEFIKFFCKTNPDIDKKELLKVSSQKWKSMSAEERKPFDDQYKEDMEEWTKKMHAWFKTLPQDQRIEQMAKQGFLSKVETKKRRRNTIMVEDPSTISPKRQKLMDSYIIKPQEKSSPKKQDANESQASIKKEELKEKQLVNISIQEVNDSKVESPKKNKKASAVNTTNGSFKEEAVVESPKKNKKVSELQNSSVEPSPSKKKMFKEAMASFGDYPSLTTAHYFMTQRYQGKPHKVAKAYKKLDRNEKKKMYAEMKKKKTQYFGKLKKYSEENVHFVEKVRHFHEKNRNQQQEALDWHINTNTDCSDDSSSSDSSDSDNS